jgi:hypothetical protein
MVGTGSPLQANFVYTPNSDATIHNLNLQIVIDGVTYFVTPDKPVITVSDNSDGSISVSVVSSLKYVADKAGLVYTDLYLNDQKVVLNLRFSSTQSLTSASLSLAPNY